MGQKIIQSYSQYAEWDCCQYRKPRKDSFENKIKTVESKKLKVERKEMYDHDSDGGDDVEEITPFQLKKLGRYQQFEKQFPFYKMDVNGYIFHINDAIA